ncbi:unnamed protein product [Amoebophrya sp. A120]|nr:unnamed protein product [Amoebophrya sp. A120]|eukprot:GSA120T00016169001.1
MAFIFVPTGRGHALQILMLRDVHPTRCSRTNSSVNFAPKDTRGGRKSSAGAAFVLRDRFVVSVATSTSRSSRFFYLSITGLKVCFRIMDSWGSWSCAG